MVGPLSLTKITISIWAARLIREHPKIFGVLYFCRICRGLRRSFVIHANVRFKLVGLLHMSVMVSLFRCMFAFVYGFVSNPDKLVHVILRGRYNTGFLVYIMGHKS